MHIAFDATSVAGREPTGVAHYGRHLISALLHTTVEPTDSYALYYKLSRFKKRAEFWSQPRTPWHYRAGMFRLGGAKPDIAHGLDVDTGPWPGVRRVATVHDLAIFKHEHLPGYSPPAFVAKKRKQYEHVLRRMHHIIAVSDCTRNDIVELFGLPISRISVVPHGVDARFRPTTRLETAEQLHDTQVLRQYGLAHKNYLLYVGALSGRKNVANMIRAYGHSTHASRLPLVLAGHRAYGYELVEQALLELPAGVQVINLGYVPDVHLPTLVRSARVQLYATYYEGFGLPVLEAMASGTAVVAGIKGAAMEIANVHGYMADPYSMESIRVALDEALDAPQARLDQGVRFAKNFTWAETAQLTRQAYFRRCANRTVFGGQGCWYWLARESRIRQ